MYEITGFGGFGSTRELIMSVQVALSKWGYPDTGGPGDWGSKLKAALRGFQSKQGFTATGFPDFGTVQALLEPESVSFADWAPFYVTATGKTPDETTWRIQVKLRQLDFNPGPIDGRMGKKTRAAIKLWQKMVGVPQTGVLDAAALKSLFTGVTVLGAEVVTGRIGERVPTPEVAVALGPIEEPAEIAAVVQEAAAAGVPVRKKREPAVSAPKLVIEREPGTGAMLSVTQLIPSAVKGRPWLWVGLSAGVVVLVGGVALYLRRRRQEG